MGEPMAGSAQRLQTFPRCPLDESVEFDPVKIGSDFCSSCYFCDGVDRECQIVFCKWHNVSTNAWWLRNRERIARGGR